MISPMALMEKVKELYLSDPNIHLDVAITKPKKLTLINSPATITGVYRHIFQIEEETSGSKKTHTLQYSDILTKQITIHELDVVIESPDPKKKAKKTQ